MLSEVVGRFEWDCRREMLLGSAIVFTLSCCSCSANSADDQEVSVDADAMSPSVSKKAGPAVERTKTKPTAKSKPAFGPKVQGLWLNRSIVVRAEPSLDAEKLGTAAAHTIVGWKRAVKAEGCEARWIEIEPRGWICEVYLEPRDKAPAGVELPKLQAAEYVPGVYGKVVVDDAELLTPGAAGIIARTPVLGSSTLRKRGQVELEGLPYWKVDGGALIAESSLRLHEPSRYQGAHLQDGTGLDLPLGFAVSSNRPGDWVVVRDAVNGKRVQRLAPRDVVSILSHEKDAAGKITAYRIGEDKFISASDVRIATRSEAPPLVGKHERWFDIDLDSQILVAYEGTLPTYATLISSGTRKNPTETGIFRIWIKFAETNMSGRMGESDAYSVAKVPWTQFYENDFALHTSYWHDRFGQQRSHGCVNLSPRDSRYLYFWSDPQVPVGWSMANGTIDSPGSIVRVHSSKDPNPEFMGYALRVQEAREATIASQ